MPAQPTMPHGMLDFIKAAAPSRRDAVGRMEMMAKLLDSAFVIPGTSQRVGIDAIIGLVPGIGDIVTTALSSYVIWEAKKPRRVAYGARPDDGQPCGPRDDRRDTGCWRSLRRVFSREPAQHAHRSCPAAAVTGLLQVGQQSSAVTGCLST